MVREDVLNELKGFIGEEMYFFELDNKMEVNGFYSVFGDGVTADVKKCRNVVYTSKTSNECEVIINFTITIDNSEDEVEENFILRVDSVERF